MSSIVSIIRVDPVTVLATALLVQKQMLSTYSSGVFECKILYIMLISELFPFYFIVHQFMLCGVARKSSNRERISPLRMIIFPYNLYFNLCAKIFSVFERLCV